MRWRVKWSLFRFSEVRTTFNLTFRVLGVTGSWLTFGSWTYFAILFILLIPLLLYICFYCSITCMRLFSWLPTSMPLHLFLCLTCVFSELQDDMIFSPHRIIIFELHTWLRIWKCLPHVVDTCFPLLVYSRSIWLTLEYDMTNFSYVYFWGN